jgi:hypothetical protein
MGERATNHQQRNALDRAVARRTMSPTSPLAPTVAKASSEVRFANGVILMIRAGHTMPARALFVSQRLAEDGGV